MPKKTVIRPKSKTTKASQTKANKPRHPQKELPLSLKAASTLVGRSVSSIQRSIDLGRLESKRDVSGKHQVSRLALLKLYPEAATTSLGNANSSEQHAKAPYSQHKEVPRNQRRGAESSPDPLIEQLKADLLHERERSKRLEDQAQQDRNRAWSVAGELQQTTLALGEARTKLRYLEAQAPAHSKVVDI